MNNKTFMQRALELAEKGKGRTSPNPMVGAVIVKGNKTIAEGYHKKAGTPHAEIIALKKAGVKARGAMLYINLEPCCHTKKKTPPCTKSIIKSGIKKVVIAMTDPNPKVSGRGIKELKKAGIKTEIGIMETEAKKLNEAFIKLMTKNEPFVILKIAQSLDGKIATSKGEAKWITGKQARKYVHKLRNEVDAVLVGINTVRKDNPSLTCRIKGGRNPYRIIVDSRLQIPLNSKVLKHKDHKTIIATIPPNLSITNDKSPLPPFTKGGLGGIKEKGGQRAVIKSPFGKGACLSGRQGYRGIFSKKEWGNYQKKIDLLKNLGTQVFKIKGKDRKVDLKSLIKELGKLGISSVMIEGGSSINSSALKSKIVDKVMVFMAPKIIGGIDAVPSVGGKSPVLLNKAFRVQNINVKTIGKDILVESYLHYGP